MSKRIVIGDQRGGAAIELAFSLPILLLILWGVVTFGSALHGRAVVARAAEDAARSISFFSNARKYGDLPPEILAPCEAPTTQLSVQCEVLNSLSRSLLILGVEPQGRLSVLQTMNGLSITTASGTCGADAASLGIKVSVPFAPLRILPPFLGFESWIPSALTACAVVAL